MKKLSKKDLKLMIKNIDENFKTLIDYIILCDSTDQDLLGLDIIDEIENNIELEKEIDLLIKDLNNRSYNISPKLLYYTMWYSIANGDYSQKILIDKIYKSSYSKEIINYLQNLNKYQSRDADFNIKKIIDSVKIKNEDY